MCIYVCVMKFIMLLLAIVICVRCIAPMFLKFRELHL
jgi:hypothetical protein